MHDGNSNYCSCPVNQDHYLCGYVERPGDDGCLDPTLGPTVNAVAWTRTGAGVLIGEEDLPTAGSRILIHDCDVFNSYYMSYWDNWQFVYNLCTTYQR